MAQNLGELQIQLTANSTQLKRELELTERLARASSEAMAKVLAGSIDSAASQIAGKRQTFQNALGSAFQGDFSALGRKVGSSVVEGIGAALRAGASGLGSILTGILQGVGQRIFMSISGMIGGAFRGLTDMSSYLKLEGAKSGVASLGVDVEKLTKQAKAASKELGYLYSTADMVKASYDVASSGFSGDDIMRVVRASTKAAAAAKDKSGGMADLDVIGDAATTILNSYKLSASEAEKVTAQMVGTVNAGKISLSDYASLIGRAASVAAAAGVSLEDLNTSIATSTVSGVKASSAIDGMRAALAAMAKPSQDAAEYAQKIGVDFSITAVKSKGFFNVLRDIQAAGAANPEGITKLFGSIEAWTALQPVFDKLKTGIGDIQKTVTGMDLSKAFNDGAKGANVMIGQAKVLKEELDLKVKTAIAPIFEAGTNALNMLLQKLVESNGTFDGLNRAANDFKNYLAVNPQVIDLIYNGIKKLLDDGLNFIVTTAKQALDYLKQHPTAIEDSVKEGIKFAQAIGGILADVAKITVELSKWAKPISEVNGLIIGDFVNGLKSALEFVDKITGGFFGIKGLMQQMGQGGQQGGRVAGPAAGSADQYVGAVLSILEAPSRQGRVDVAQVIANRVQNNYGGYGASIRDQAFAPGQFEPFFGENKNAIQDRDSAIAALKKKGYSAKEASDAIDQFFADVRDAGKVQDSAKSVANRAHFKGTSMYGNMVPGEDFLRQKGENFFHYDGSDRQFKTGNVASLFAGGLSSIASTAFSVAQSTQQFGPQAPFGPPAPKKSSPASSAPTVASTGDSPRAQQQVFPVIGSFPITSGYGMREHPVYGGQKFHDGIDLGTPTGTPIVSPLQGKVIRAGGTQGGDGPFGGYGKLVEVEFADKTTAFFAHLSEIAVKVGQEVAAGQLLGKSGDSGIGTGAHLHLGASDAKGRSADPSRFLRGTKLNAPVQGGAMGSAGLQSLEMAAQNDPLEALKQSQAQAAISAAEGLISPADMERRANERRLREQNRATRNAELQSAYAGAPDAEAKSVADRRMKSRDVEVKFEEQLIELQQKRSDLEKARDRKTSDPAWAQKYARVDFSAAIKQIDDLVAATNRQKQAELNAIGATETAEDKRKAIEQSRQNRDRTRNAEQKKYLSDLQRQQDLESDPYKQSVIAGTMETASIEFDIENSMRPLRDAVEDLLERRQYLVKIGADKKDIDAIDAQVKAINQEMTSVSEQGAARLEGLAAKLQRQEDERKRSVQQANAQAEALTSGSQSGLLRARAGLMGRAGDEFGANELQRQAALLEEQQRYNAEILSIEKQIFDLRQAGATISDETVGQLKANAQALSEINLASINDQFKTLDQTIAETGKNAFGTFLESMLTGTASLKDAFKSLVGSILQSLARLAVNSLFKDLFGGGLLGAAGGGKKGGGILMDVIGGIFNAKDGGVVPNFASGGMVNALPGADYKSGYGAISDALRREGSNAVLAALTPGEQVLNVMEAAKYRKLFPNGINSVANFAAGGTVGVLAGAAGAVVAKGNNQNFTLVTNVTVPSNSNIDPGTLKAYLDSRINDALLKAQEPGGALNPA